MVISVAMGVGACKDKEEAPKYNCATCHDKGYLYCPNCSVSTCYYHDENDRICKYGYMSVRCNNCYGFGTLGSTYCPDCGGDGYDKNYFKCDDCHGSGVKTIDCPRCDAGYIQSDDDCPKCIEGRTGGTRESKYSDGQYCGECSRSNKIDCPDCGE